MKKKHLILLFIILISSCLLYGQDSEFEYRKLCKTSKCHLITEDSILRPYYISETPITNKEYITYLCWITDVYGLDYPEVLLDAFPTLQRNQTDCLLSAEFHVNKFEELINSNELTRDYIFNPKYLNYPIIGITWKQASIFLNWLSDRYNEHDLIRRGILNFKPNLINENSFNTESFLEGQFFWNRSMRESFDPNTAKGVKVEWHHRLLIPSFRLPSFYEINGVKNTISKSFKPYKANSFLKCWIKYYLNIKGDKLTLNYGETHENVIQIKTNKTFHFADTQAKEFYLDTKQAKYETDILKIYSKWNQYVIVPKIEYRSVSKDSLGHMPYIIIAEDANLNPIFIQRNYNLEMNSEAENGKALYIFRYALSAIRE